MTFDRVPLSQVATIVQGGRHGLSGNHFVDPADGYPAFGAGGLNGYLETFEFEKPAVVLSSIGARCGKCFLTNGRWSSLANTQVILPNPSQADVRFLWYQLNDEASWLRSGTAQPFIKPSTVKQRLVALPPLPEQRRIADILDKADAIRRKRKEAIALTEELLRSAFLEMFGDPVTNPMGWPVKPFGELLAQPLRNGLSPASGGKFDAEVLTLSAITRGQFDASASKPGVFAVEPGEDVRVNTKDFLICRGNGNVSLVGTGAFPLKSMKGMVFPDTMIAARIDQARIRPAYLSTIWKSSHVRRQIEAAARTTNGTFKVNQTVVESIEIGLPPLTEQQAFSDLATRLATNTDNQHLALESTDHLFNSILVRAFSGDL